MAEQPKDRIVDAESQRKALEESERHAHAKQPRNFKDDALKDKQVRVEPDGTGPTSTGSFDTEQDRARGSGNDAGDDAGAQARGNASGGRGEHREDDKRDDRSNDARGSTGGKASR